MKRTTEKGNKHKPAADEKREIFWQEVDEAYRQMSPVEIADFKAEMAIWDVTLQDGLEEFKDDKFD